MKRVEQNFWLDSTLILGREKIADHGEDAWVYDVGEDRVMVGAFDGLGGSGAKRYEAYDGRTGAYIASRAAADAADAWLRGGELSEESLHRSICEELRAYKAGAGTPGGAVIKGSMTREFPTTVSVAVCRPAADGVTADFYWAGDSRGYILDENGLTQITRDDVNDADDILAQMDSDGVMNNLASLSKAWTLHRTRREHIPAGIAFTATDGCFGYVRTPMEFEYQLLETMCAAECVDDWQNRLEDTLRECAGDDFTLLGVIFGYGEFSAMQRRFRPRLEWLRKTYIEPLETAAPAEINAMWLNYSRSYYA